MANTGEKIAVLAVVGILTFVGLSYTITGDLVSNPADWLEQINNPTYQASFTVSRSTAIGYISIENVKVKEKSLSIAPKSLGIIPGVCLTGYFRGTTIAEVETPQGTIQRLAYDPNLKLCRRQSKPYSETFIARTTGSYKINIKVIGQDGNIATQKTVNKYITVR